MTMLGVAVLSVILLVTGMGAKLWESFSRSPDRAAYLTKVYPTPFGLIDVLLLSVGWILVPGVVATMVMAIWEFPRLESLTATQINLQIVVTAMCQLVFCVSGCWILVARYGTLARVLGVDASAVPEHAWLAVRAFCMVVPVVLLIQTLLSLLVPYKHETIDQLMDHFSLATALTTWFAAVLVAPICEEIVFRGVLQGWLQRIGFGTAAENGFAELVGGWAAPSSDAAAGSTAAGSTAVPADSKFGVGESDAAATPVALGSEHLPQPPRSLPRVPSKLISWWMPVVASSALFAAVHIGQGLAPISLFVFALALGFLYRSTGSIVPSIILHFLLNAFSMVQLTLQAILDPIRENL